MHGPNHSNKYCHYVKQGTTIFYKYELLMFLCVCQLKPITEWKHCYTFITYTFDNWHFTTLMSYMYIHLITDIFPRMTSVNRNRDGEPRPLRGRATRGHWTSPSSDRKCQLMTNKSKINKWRRGRRLPMAMGASLGCRRIEWTRWDLCPRP